MSPDWVTTAASVFTAIVIAASAAAALIQIRHMRKGNEIEIMQKWTESIQSPEFEQARAFVLREMPRILSDPERVRALSWANALPADFEYLAALSERHISANPEGTYPAGTPHMPVDTSLIALFEKGSQEDG
jgi:hypothetical protein